MAGRCEIFQFGTNDAIQWINLSDPLDRLRQFGIQNGVAYPGPLSERSVSADTRGNCTMAIAYGDKMNELGWHSNACIRGNLFLNSK